MWPGIEAHAELLDEGTPLKRWRLNVVQDQPDLPGPITASAQGWTVEDAWGKLCRYLREHHA